MAKKQPAQQSSTTDILDAVAPKLDDRLSGLMSSVTKITEKKWGLPDAVAIPGLQPQQFQKRIYSTGLTSLDQKLKIGGLPRGHITELYGSPHAGKSLLLYQIIASVQHTCIKCHSEIVYRDITNSKGEPLYHDVPMLVRGEPQTIKVKRRTSICDTCGSADSGGLFVLFDQENSFDPVWTEQQGVELTKMVVMKLPTGEHALDILRMVMHNHKPEGIGIDSIAQLQPKTEQERSAVDDATMIGLHAKVMSQLCRHVTSAFLEDPKNAPLFVWVNQTRADVSGNGAIKVTGGHAPEFYSSIRIYMLRRGLVNQQHPEYGTNGRITIKKCKAAKGVTNHTVDYIIVDDGFDKIKDLYDTARASGVFNPIALQTGRHYWAEDTVKENELARKEADALERLRTDEEFRREVRSRTLAGAAGQAVADVYVGDFTAEEE